MAHTIKYLLNTMSWGFGFWTCWSGWFWWKPFCVFFLLRTLPFSFYLIGDKPVGFLGDSEEVYRTQFSCFFTNRARRSMDSTTTTNGRGAEMVGYFWLWWELLAAMLWDIIMMYNPFYNFVINFFFFFGFFPCNFLWGWREEMLFNHPWKNVGTSS